MNAGKVSVSIIGICAIVLLVSLPCISFTGCSIGREPVSHFPTSDWISSTPEEQGVDSAKLAEGLLAIKQENLNIHSLLLIRNGSVILDAYFYPYDGKSVHEFASVTKSVMTALIAIAADQDKLELDQPMLSFFQDRSIANVDKLKERITVRHLASMSSGLDSMGFERDEGTLDEMRASKDWIQFALDRKVVSESGTHFVYDSPGMHILSAILQEATGMTALEFARQNLFEPLGIKEVQWDTDPQGFNHGWADLFLNPRDAAKIGYLWLNNGVWEGRQIVSKKWVENSVKVQIETGIGDDYGYGWWIMHGDEEAYAAIGRGGQRIQVWPDLNAILVMTGGGVDIDDIEPFIAPAFVFYLQKTDKPLSENPSGITELNTVLTTILQAPEPKAVAPVPDIAKEISGKTFVFGPNAFQLKTMRLDFNESNEAAMELTFSNDQDPRSGGVGLDGVYRMSPGDYGLPIGQRGYWADAQTFILEYDEIANRDAYIITMRFDGNLVIIEGKERTRESGVRFEGKLRNP